MNIYLRKILAHDISHQISITNEVLNGFFGVYSDKETAIMRGKKSGQTGVVSFLLATDPRFGGDIKQIINAEGGMQEDDILLFTKTRAGYDLEVVSFDDSRHSTFISIMNIERHLIVNIDDEQNLANDAANILSNEAKGENVLLYGVPGCGKSRYIKDNYCNDPSRMERVVFHPDYTNSDFIGQILPVVDYDENTNTNFISYDFQSGPFTRILEKATNHSENNYYLVIEEINRGNAPAIFGEVFQLLDRKNGESEYPINNENIAECVYGSADKNHPIKIPSNLTILATMNTADQNVFTLDTAFKRRWKMQSIPNDIEKCENKDVKIAGTDITWKDFVTTINNKILELNVGLGSEDKRLGAYFATKEEIVSPTLFAEKVIMYLWNDAFKHTGDKVFDKTDTTTLEDIVDRFSKEKFAIFDKSISFSNSHLNLENDTLNESI